MRLIYIHRMKIVADPNIPFVKEAFEDFGEVILRSGREWTADLVKDASILLSRSVTKVNRALLENSSVQFVGTATSGFDHVDVDYLRAHSIKFAYCPGSNAVSVAEYILSALLAVCDQSGQELSEMTAAIIGHGHVGREVEKRLRAVGVECLLNDPPVQAMHKADQYRPLETVLGADIITLHTPLTSKGEHPTLGLIDQPQLELMKPNVILINAARGGVISESALLDKMAHHPQMKTIIDCWQNEPDINLSLLSQCTLGTPHIAGYSFDGKIKATERLYAAVCDHFSWEQHWSASNIQQQVRLDLSDATTHEEVLKRAVMACYDVRQDASDLREGINLSQADRAVLFDQLRKNYPKRFEFDRLRLTLPEQLISDSLRDLTFVLE